MLILVDFSIFCLCFVGKFRRELQFAIVLLLFFMFSEVYELEQLVKRIVVNDIAAIKNV